MVGKALNANEKEINNYDLKNDKNYKIRKKLWSTKISHKTGNMMIILHGFIELLILFNCNKYFKPFKISQRIDCNFVKFGFIT